MGKVIIAYGFEYRDDINYNNQTIKCKCIENDNLFYAAPIYLEEYNINKICNKIKEIEASNINIFNYTDILARLKGLNATWKLVYYNEKTDEIRNI